MSTIPLWSTGTPGASPTNVAGAPAVPAKPSPSNFPAYDLTPPVDSPEVKQWVSEINWDLVPKLSTTTGECATSPEAAADASRCWWTCGGCTRETDISVCPNKLDWGVSFDDGPSPYTPLLLDYLNTNNIKSTFFVVGSRVLSYPDILITEYLAGHQISVHTWAHASLTKLSNEQIVAELGWTKKAIKDTIGVTPNTFRPPYGDIDDRVRAIAAQMGLTPIMWSRYEGKAFDTTDWNIPGGQANGETALSKFESILEEMAPKLDTGFIVLEHDLYQQTVDLAVGYFLPMAISSGKYAMKSISDCLGIAPAEAYIETSANSTQTQKPGSSTVFQPSVGTATGEVAPVTTGGSAGGAGSGSAGGAAQTGKPANAAAQAAAPLALTLGAVAVAAVYAF